MIDPTLVGLKSVFFFPPFLFFPPLFRSKQILYSNRRGTIDSVIPAPLPRLTSRKKSSAVFVWARRLSPPVPAGLARQCLCGLELRSAVSDIKEHYLRGGHLGRQVLYISTKALRHNIAGISTGVRLNRLSPKHNGRRLPISPDMDFTPSAPARAVLFNLFSRASRLYCSCNFATFCSHCFKCKTAIAITHAYA